MIGNEKRFAKTDGYWPGAAECWRVGMGGISGASFRTVGKAGIAVP
jgi:hypothetical protein